MMAFSTRNGLKMTWAHLNDPQMALGWFMFMVVIPIALLEWGVMYAVAWFIIGNILYILIRCWDDPVKLGWCES